MSSQRSSVGILIFCACTSLVLRQWTTHNSPMIMMMRCGASFASPVYLMLWLKRYVDGSAQDFIGNALELPESCTKCTTCSRMSIVILQVICVNHVIHKIQKSVTTQGPVYQDESQIRAWISIYIHGFSVGCIFTKACLKFNGRNWGMLGTCINIRRFLSSVGTGPSGCVKVMSIATVFIPPQRS